MPNIGPANPENHILGDVGGVVRNPFQVSCEGENVQSLNCRVGMRAHGTRKAGESFAVDSVDFVVGLKQMLGQLGVGLNERPQGVPHHSPNPGCHRGDVDGKFGGRQFDHVHDPLYDIDRLVIDALKIGVDLDDRQDKAQIDGHWLLHSEQIDGQFVHFALGAIDGLIRWR
jgi:hypothetical protein